MKTTIPTDTTKPPRLTLEPAVFAALYHHGSAVLPILRPESKAAAALQLGKRVEIRSAAAGRRRPVLLGGCVVGRREERHPADTFPPGVIPRGHRGPVVALSVVTDTHAEALRVAGPLSELLPHYVAPART